MIRVLLAVEFLVAIPAVFTLWSQTGGQFHLDLMLWPWKLGLGLAAAGLVTAITAALVRSEGRVTRDVLLRCSLLIATMLVAGAVTYYYHLNEPTDEEGDEDPQQSTQLYEPGPQAHYFGSRASSARSSRPV